MNPLPHVDRAIANLSEKLLEAQSPDGAFRFCLEGGPMTDANLIILLRSLELEEEALIARLADRLLAIQRPDGSWRLYEDERKAAGSLSSTVEAYNGLLFSKRIEKTDPRMEAAKRFILSAGGLERVNLFTNVTLYLTGQKPWTNLIGLPLEIVLLPVSFPVNLFDLFAAARVHMIPILVAQTLRYTHKLPYTPDLSDLYADPAAGKAPGETTSWSDIWAYSLNDTARTDYRGLQDIIFRLLKQIYHWPANLKAEALKQAERFMLERIEPDGSLFSYASSTFLMIFALLALGYDKRHPIIVKAVSSMKRMECNATDAAVGTHAQIFTSEIWDTALSSHALQEAGLTPSHPSVQTTGQYLLREQQTRYGDWRIHNPTEPGGWGFSENNTRIPDVDDTTAALRAISRLRMQRHTEYKEAWNKGLNWLLSMQNDDGGWAAFEKNTDSKLLAFLSVPHAREILVEPSTADLTGRTLEFLGNTAGLKKNVSLVRKGVKWLLDNQEQDGSWYGRWGVCYIYGTWAAVTGLAAAGLPSDHPAMRKAAKWLLGIQRPDGGFGESCASDLHRHYIPLDAGTPSQTAWALDALVALNMKRIPEIDKAAYFLTQEGNGKDWAETYPTGAALPGGYYIRYHSYGLIWPLLALSHYKERYGADQVR
ncbi:prenyltransferase/squalene oxidase repeat-containing protein [Paenibacillus contaminans]|uniref:Squalene--hopene cyclase n=1 Tax=Paenibacillus contaminans TaxID=450362 RepID=A0A329MR82_9BACL|nr:prenyltransferase/squalene oxidase repeat-containing protein [Paenibacillus contaminans]RAV21818.1 squalene--hopene cyclase [Paenibacillus contaminans]